MSMTAELLKYDDFFKPTLEALIALGGSGSIEELESSIVDHLKITQDQLDICYPGKNVPIVTHRMAFARSWLKVPNFVSNPKKRDMGSYGRGSVCK